jgi:hypothetical protein
LLSPSAENINNEINKHMDRHLKKLIKFAKNITDEKKIEIIKRMGLLDGSAEKRTLENGYSRAADDAYVGDPIDLYRKENPNEAW